MYNILNELTEQREQVCRKYRVALCPNCWREQKDEEVIISHLMDTKCDGHKMCYPAPRDYSIGVCMTQYNDLKSK
jgi:hypothetical protein